MEDTLFAGAVVSRIREHFTVNCDSAIMAEAAYNTAKGDLFGVMKQASHFKRLANYGLEKDIRYCLTEDGANVLPIFKNGELVVV
jgi:2-phosphosulfolactate phosphatase